MAFSASKLLREGTSMRSFNKWMNRNNFGRRLISTTVSGGGVWADPSRTTSLSPPWLMIPPSYNKGGELLHNFYSLAENKVVSLGKPEVEEGPDEALLVGSSHGWLAVYNDDDKKMDLFLANPLSLRLIKLPPIQTIPIRKIKDTYWRTPEKPVFNDGLPVPRGYEDFVYSSKHKQLFCVTKFQNLEAWDLEGPQSPRIIWKKNAQHDLEHEGENYPWAARSEKEIEVKTYCLHTKYLVIDEESNQLFLVTRHINENMALDVKPVYLGPEKGLDVDLPYKTVGFDVHKINPEKGELKYMDGSLDGLAMFIGLNHGFTLSADAATRSYLKPNSIYFTDDKHFTPPYWDGDREYGGHDVGIFHYENATLSPCYYPCDIKSVKRIMPPPMWFAPSSREFISLLLSVKRIMPPN